jgi:hypothetical protein
MNTIGIHLTRRRQFNSARLLTGARESRQIRSYAELQKQLHNDLLAQHPEWIDPDGNCPTCDEYDRRLAKVISIFQGASQQA